MRLKAPTHWKRALTALFAGALATLAFAPVNAWSFALISPALFWLALRPLKPKAAFWIGWCYGSGFFGAGVSWVFVSIHHYGGASTALATLLTALFCIALGLLFAIQAVITQRLLYKRTQAWLGFTGLWVIFEWIRSWLFTGFPWLYLGYAGLGTPWHNWAPIGGVWLLSLCFALLAAGAAECCIRVLKPGKPARYSLWPLLPGILTLLIGPLLPAHWTHAEGEPLSTTLIQPNIPQLDKWRPELRQSIISREIEQSLNAPHSDLLIWPETAIPGFLSQIAPRLAPFIHYLNRENTTLISGVLTAEKAPETRRGERYFNSIVSFGDTVQIYRKHHLVPFGEYVPFENELRGLITFFDLPMSAFSIPKAPQHNLEVKGINIAPAICYEIAYPELVRKQSLDAELLLTISNDTWFGRSLGPAQHLEIAQMRAVETGRWVIRATNNGYSAVINSDGQLASTLPVDHATLLHAQVQPMTGTTPFQRLGLWPGLGGAVILLSLGLGLGLRRKA